MQSIVRFRHCGRSIYTFSPQEQNQAGGAGGRCQREEENQAGGAGGRCQWEEQNQAGGAGGRCPLCGDLLSFQLLDAPVVLLSPFSNGHETPWALLISSRSGPPSISEQNESELHVGISNSTGVVFSYTESGVQRQQHGWEQSLTIPLVTPSNHASPPLLPGSVLRSWDRHLETFSSQDRWTTDSEQNESELHVGISNSTGVVFSYTESGVQRQQHGWEQSLTIPLVTPSNHASPPLLPGSVLRSWDRHLETFSSQDRWTTDRFDEVTHNCYTYCLGFINRVLEVGGRGPLTKQQFTERYVLPRTTAAARYTGLLQVLKKQPYYLVERQAGPDKLASGHY
ncbi:hypothetical protein CRUP_032247 [Coryphaenoides rupestris]|nr:hypothetical protein CRUP_032247 [Coryphaenoides rupestris]